MAQRITKDELPHGETAHTFEGARYGDVGVSFFMTDAPPGSRTRLHTHPYAEVFVVQEGHVTFTVADVTIEATGNQIVIVPPGQPHMFVNSGSGRLRQISLHASTSLITEWLED